MSKKRPNRKRKKSKAPEDEAVMPDHRTMDKMMGDISRLLGEQDFESMDDASAFLQQLMDSGQPIPERELETPLEKAQDLMYTAWDTPSKRERVKLARKALSISKDCADAYVLLAEESARSLKKAKVLYLAGVRAGERAIGPEAFEEYRGHFWGIHKTRPYMRARQGLAACLWQMGQRQESIKQYQEMLLLNPGDNQGIRYSLLLCLMEEGPETETEQLLDAYDDAGASWCFNEALFLFRKGVARRKATAALREAIEFNPHVPAYLLGHKRLPRHLPPYIGVGDETEAADYATRAITLWLREKGAIDWLREVSADM